MSRLKMKEITGEIIMLAWLKERYETKEVFSDREIELSLHGFARRNFPEHNHLPGSWSRYFRFVRGKDLLRDKGLTLSQVTDKRKFQGLKTWELKLRETNDRLEMILE